MSRYIDADKLIGDLHNQAFLEGDDRSICYNVIQKQSSANVRENVHGEWVEPQRDRCMIWDKRAYAQCSICGYKQFFGREKNFCPNCGADMREVTK